MASSAKAILLEESLTAAGATGSTEILGTKSKDFICTLVVKNYAGTVVNAVVEHSPDGENWITLSSLTLSANGIDSDVPTTPVLGYVRARVTSTPTADVRIDLNYAESR